MLRCVQEAAQPEVAHALAVRAALAAADYRRFFRLYASAPALGRALMDIYVPHLRFDALSVAVKAFKPSLPLPFLATLLGFAAPVPAPAEKAAAAADVAAGGGAEGVSGKSGAGSDLGGSTARRTEPGGGTTDHTSRAAGAAAAAGGTQELLPGCMETYFEGEHVAKVGGWAGWVGWCLTMQPLLALPACLVLACRLTSACRPLSVGLRAWRHSHPPTYPPSHVLTLVRPSLQADLGEGCADCLAWLEECGAAVKGATAGPTKAALDCKESAGQLKMPEEKKKVAHGDANLQIEDFLKTLSPGGEQEGGW
jgi:hypothetical protein